MSRALLLLLFALSGCGGGSEEQASGPSLDTNQIEHLSRPKEEKADLQAGARLEPLLADELALLAASGPICTFRSDESVLLAASATEAIARQQGQILRPLVSSPMGPSGGFFEHRFLSISIGRTGQASPSASPGGGGSARMTVTDRRSETQVERVGTWTCRG